MTTVLLVAPAAVDGRADFLGRRSNPPLSALGEKQSITLRGALQELNPDEAFASPLTRSMSTAALSMPSGVSVKPDPRLDEVDFGAWDGRSLVDLEREDDLAVHLYRREPLARRFPDGETLDEAFQRIDGFLEDLLQTTADSASVVVFSHPTLLRLGLARIIGMSLGAVLGRLEALDETSITRVTLGRAGGSLGCYNDISHTPHPDLVSRRLRAQVSPTI